MNNPLDRIGVLMFVDPISGITLKQAKDVLDAVLAFNDDGRPLGRAGLTGQNTTTTQWPWILEYIHYAAIERRQGSAVRIFGDLQGITSRLAAEIHKMGALLFGEWFAPSLDNDGVDIMSDTGGWGLSKKRVKAMLDGIEKSLAVKALTGLEFQINRRNIQHVEGFIRLCKKLGIEPHLEMQEVPFCLDIEDFQNIRYRHSLPPHYELKQLATAITKINGSKAEELLSPFFCRGNSGLQFGACNYWFENGVFVRPDGQGGLIRTACLADKTVIDTKFEPSIRRLQQHQSHGLVTMRKALKQSDMAGTKCLKCDLWPTCRGGCRAMAFLAFGHRFAPDPNCWHRD